MSAKQFSSQHLHTLKTHNGPVNAITFSSSPGTYLLTGSSDRSIHLARAVPSSTNTYPAESTAPIQRYEAHGYSVLDIAVTADNARFASVGGDRAVFLWDVEQGITTRRWSGHNARIEAVQFAGEGDAVVVSGSADTTINLWDARASSHKPLQTLPEATDTVSTLHAHMPLYSIVSGSYDGRVRIYDIRMGQTTVDVLGAPVTSVRCSGDGNAVLVSTLDGRIRVLDRGDGKLLKAFPGEKERDKEGEGPAYRNEELRIRSVFAVNDGVVLSGSEAEKGEDDKGAWGGRFVQAGIQSQSQSKKQAQAYVFAWDVLSGEAIASVPAGEGVRAVSCVAWNEKREQWAGGCSDGTVKVYG